MTTTNKHYVYIYLDIRKSGSFKYGNLEFMFEPIYIGKGKNNRMNQHLCPYYRKDKINNTFFYKKIEKIYRETGKYPIGIKYLENISDSESKNIEKELIKLIGRKDLKLGPLTNLTDGGDGVINNIITDKARTHSGTFKKGNIVSQEIRDKISKSTKGIKKLTEEHKINISRNKGCKPILQYSLEGFFIKEWNTIQECTKNGYFCVSRAIRTSIRMGNEFLWIKKETDLISSQIEPYKFLKRYKNKPKFKTI